MEYADGGDLAKVVADRKEQGAPGFKEEDALVVLAQCSQALAHVHARRVLHRDIKGQNIFLTTSGVVKLGDFGIAKVLETTQAEAKTMIGTPNYLAPEVCENRPYGGRADIWSIGIVFYELLTLQQPFQAYNIAALVLKIITGTPSPLPEHYSEDARSLCMSLLEKTPEKRPSADELLNKPLVRREVGVKFEPVLARGKSSHGRSRPNSSKQSTAKLSARGSPRDITAIPEGLCDQTQVNCVTALPQSQPSSARHKKPGSRSGSRPTSRQTSKQSGFAEHTNLDQGKDAVDDLLWSQEHQTAMLEDFRMRQEQAAQIKARIQGGGVGSSIFGGASPITTPYRVSSRQPGDDPPLEGHGSTGSSHWQHQERPLSGVSHFERHLGQRTFQSKGSQGQTFATGVQGGFGGSSSSRPGSRNSALGVSGQWAVGSKGPISSPMQSGSRPNSRPNSRPQSGQSRGGESGMIAFLSQGLGGRDDHGYHMSRSSAAGAGNVHGVSPHASVTSRRSAGDRAKHPYHHQDDRPLPTMESHQHFRRSQETHHADYRHPPQLHSALSGSHVDHNTRSAGMDLNSGGVSNGTYQQLFDNTAGSQWDVPGSVGVTAEDLATSILAAGRSALQPPPPGEDQLAAFAARVPWAAKMANADLEQARWHGNGSDDHRKDKQEGLEVLFQELAKITSKDNKPEDEKLAASQGVAIEDTWLKGTSNPKSGGCIDEDGFGIDEEDFGFGFDGNFTDTWGGAVACADTTQSNAFKNEDTLVPADILASALK